MKAPQPDDALPADSIHEPLSANPSPSRGLLGVTGPNDEPKEIGVDYPLVTARGTWPGSGSADEPLRQYHKQDCNSFCPGWDCDCGFSKALETYLARREEAAYDAGYKQGVTDELACVESSGEHVDLQGKLATTREAAVLAGQIDLIRELNGEGDVHWSITDGKLRLLQAEQVKLTRKDGDAKQAN